MAETTDRGDRAGSDPRGARNGSEGNSGRCGAERFPVGFSRRHTRCHDPGGSGCRGAGASQRPRLRLPMLLQLRPRRRRPRHRTSVRPSRFRTVRRGITGRSRRRAGHRTSAGGGRAGGSRGRGGTRRPDTGAGRRAACTAER